MIQQINNYFLNNLKQTNMKNKMKVPWTLNKNYFMILMGSALVSFNSLLQA